MLNGILFFALGLGLASPGGQQVAQRRHVIDPEAELERIMDPPAPPRYHLMSPPGHSPFGLLTSVQLNVNSLGQNIVGDAANEPSIVVDPNNPNNIAIAWRQFNDVASNFREGGYAYSTDGGKTWVAAPPSLQAKTTVTGLPAGTSVQFRYRAVTKTGAEDWSTPVTLLVK